MQAQIAHAVSRLEEEPTQQAKLINHAAQLQEQDQQLVENMEEEMTHRTENECQFYPKCTSSRWKK